MSSLNLTSLPIEILEEIFMNLKLNDIKNLSLVCKSFNEVIGSSSAVMNRMIIQWNGEYESRYDGIINSNRIYRNAEIRNVYKISTKLSNYLIGASLTELDLSKCNLKASEFKFIMKSISKTIVKLHIIHMKFERDCDVLPVEFPNLKKLGFHHTAGNSASILNIFYGAKNVEVIINDCKPDGNSDYYSTFWRVIGSMEQLKDLTSFCTAFGKVNLNDEILSANFKLEKLNIRDDIKNQAHNNLFKFIEIQQTSLKEFSWSGSEVTSQLLQLILNMPALTNVRLFETSALTNITDRNEIFFNKNYSIRELSFGELLRSNQNTERLMRNFITNCCALKKLKSTAHNIAPETLYTLANMNHLEKLCLDASSSFVPIAMPHVKELVIFDCLNLAVVIEMIRLNTHLKKLKVLSSTTSHPDYENAIAGLSADAVVEVTCSYYDNYTDQEEFEFYLNNF